MFFFREFRRGGGPSTTSYYVSNILETQPPSTKPTKTWLGPKITPSVCRPELGGCTGPAAPPKFPGKSNTCQIYWPLGLRTGLPSQMENQHLQNVPGISPLISPMFPLKFPKFSISLLSVFSYPPLSLKMSSQIGGRGHSATS